MSETVICDECGSVMVYIGDDEWRCPTCDGWKLKVDDAFQPAPGRIHWFCAGCGMHIYIPEWMPVSVCAACDEALIQMDDTENQQEVEVDGE